MEHSKKQSSGRKKQKFGRGKVGVKEEYKKIVKALKDQLVEKDKLV